MTRNITATPEQMLSAADKIESISIDYQKVYMKMYTEIDNMRTAWDGADNAAYTAQVKGFEDDFQLMYKLMLDYAAFVRMSAKAYKHTQDEIISAAGNLSVGASTGNSSIRDIIGEKLPGVLPVDIMVPSPLNWDASEVFNFNDETVKGILKK